MSTVPGYVQHEKNIKQNVFCIPNRNTCTNILKHDKNTDNTKILNI